MEITVFTGWARREGLLLNSCLPLDFQKPGKVFLMPCTDVCKGITHTNSFWCYKAWGLLCAEDKQSRQSMPWRSWQIRVCWSWWNSQHSYNGLVVLLSLQWLHWVHDRPVSEECSSAAMALRRAELAGGARKGHNTRMATKGRWDLCVAMGLDRLFRFGFMCIREAEVWLGRLIN